MAKEVKRFETVKEYSDTLDRFKKDKARLDSNQKWFEKRFGESGGTVQLDDGPMSLTAKEPNGRDSTAYKPMLEELEELIISGKLYQINKDSAAEFMLRLREKHTKPQMASQKIEVKATANVENESKTGLVKTIGS